MQRLPWRFAAMWRRMEKRGASWEAKMVMLNDLRRYQQNRIHLPRTSSQNTPCVRQDARRSAAESLHDMVVGNIR
jgi:hypothetical protein